jgi:hypothetical protein
MASFQVLSRIPTIDFMQAWQFENYSVSDLSSHFEKLKNIGIDTVILQSIAEVEGDKILKCQYNSAYAKSSNDNVVITDYVDRVFQASKSAGMNVILGLGFDANWWNGNNHQYGDDVISKWISVDKAMIGELYDRYPLAGWYFSYEMYSNDQSYELPWAKMVSETASEVDRLTPELPLYLSPFHSNYYKMNDSKVHEMWKNFFENAGLRPIDVFAPQDGFGSLPPYYNREAAEDKRHILTILYDACHNYSQARFFINTELFASEGFAQLSRVGMQLEMEGMIAEGLLCFSISHYYLVGDPSLYAQYQNLIGSFNQSK